MTINDTRKALGAGTPADIQRRLDTLSVTAVEIIADGATCRQVLTSIAGAMLGASAFRGDADGLALADEVISVVGGSA